MSLCNGPAAALLMAALSCVPASAQSPDGAQEHLLLTCLGQTSRFENDMADTVRRSYGESTQLEIINGKGRIHVPEKLALGEAEWFDLQDLKMEPTKITAQFRMSFLTRPSVMIDRLSGEIHIKYGGNEFYGNCNRTADKPKF